MNDRRPCGADKKYKKCCGLRQLPACVSD
ncbi:hypothetical protein WDV93_09240 [Pantoea ananatis]